MKKEIHPKYFSKSKVMCACGNSFDIGATVEKINIEICSACHPFYTGEKKIVDTAGRVEKFKAKRLEALKIKSSAKPKRKTPPKEKKNKI